MTVCAIHVQILEPEIPCPSCAAGDPPDDPECVRLGHQRDPSKAGQFHDCVRCHGPMAFSFSATER